jgi:hypothetical protein
MARARAVVVSLVTLLLVVPAGAARAASGCGAERRDIKSGFDDAARSIDPSNPTPATVATLAAKDAPSPIPKDSRVGDAETTVWAVDATLTSFKLESDSDYHLVLDDGAGNTMIAEIPSPDCIADGTSAFADKITSARAELDAQFTASTQFQDADVPVHVIGVGLFDFSHGQRGFAANGIELHPVLDIQFTGGGAGAGPSPDAQSLLARPARPAGAPVALHLWTAMRLFQKAEAEGGAKPARTWRAAGGAAVTAGAGAAAGGAQPAPATPAGAAPTAIAPRPGTAAPAAAAAHRATAQAKLATGGKQQVLYQDLDVPSAVSDAALRFAIHVSSDQQTGRVARLRVQVRDPSGKRPAATIQAYSNLDANPGFDDQSLDLSRFRGHKVRIAFLATGRPGTSFTIDDPRLALRK